MAELVVFEQNNCRVRSIHGDTQGSLDEIKERLAVTQDVVVKCDIYGSSKRPFIDVNLLLGFSEIGHLSVKTQPLPGLREMTESDEFAIVEVVDLTPLQYFSKLTTLSLRYCVRDLQGIERCTSLRRLWLADLPVSDLSSLSGSSLTHLHLSNVQFDSLVPINKELRSLTVSLSRRSIRALLTAERFPNLEALHLELRPSESEIADYNVNRRRSYQGYPVGYQFCCSYLEYLACVDDLREIIGRISGLENLEATWNLHCTHGDLKIALSYFRD